MNLNFVLLVFIFLIVCLIPHTSANFMVIKRLISDVFKSSSNDDDRSMDSPKHPVGMERSSLISENDIKFPTNGQNFKDGGFKNDGLLKNNLIRRIQEMISGKSADSNEQSSIVNIDDETDDTNSDDSLGLSDDNSIDLDSINKLVNNNLNQPQLPQIVYGQPTDYDYNGDYEEDDEDEDDEFDGKFHKKNVNKNHFNHSINGTNHHSNITNEINNQHLNQHLNHTLAHHNQTYRLINSSSSFNNQTNTSSYVYLNEPVTQQTLLKPIIDTTKLIGNQLKDQLLEINELIRFLCFIIRSYIGRSR